MGVSESRIRPIYSLKIHSSSISSLHSPVHQSYVYTAGTDGQIKVWDGQNLTDSAGRPTPHSEVSVSESSISGITKILAVDDREDKLVIGRKDGTIVVFADSPSQRVVSPRHVKVSIDHEMRVNHGHHQQQRRHLHTMPGIHNEIVLVAHSRSVSAIEVLVEENILFSSGMDGFVKAWPWSVLGLGEDDAFSFSYNLDSPIYGMVVMEHGTEVAVAGSAPHVAIVDAVHQCEKTRVPSDHVLSLSNNESESELRAGFSHGGIGVIDKRKGAYVNEWIAHDNAVLCLKSIDLGYPCLLSGSMDHTIKVWDMRNPSTALSSYLTLDANLGGIRSLDIDGFTVLGGGDSGILHIWDIEHAISGLPWRSSVQNEPDMSMPMRSRSRTATATVSRGRDGGDDGHLELLRFEVPSTRQAFTRSRSVERSPRYHNQASAMVSSFPSPNPDPNLDDTD